MNKKLFRIIGYFRFYSKAKTIYNIHSPHLFDFINLYTNLNKKYYCFSSIEHERKKLLNSKVKITFNEMGAGFNQNVLKYATPKTTTIRDVSQIAKSSLSSRNQGRLLFHLVDHYKCKNILEFGTSLGISTSYLAKANSEAKITTIEGNNSSLNIANQVFRNLKIENIHSINANFDDFIKSDEFHSSDNFDLVYLDGNHTFQSTIKYFKALLPKLTPSAIVVLDDIYWSQGMYDAWFAIYNDLRVVSSIDLYELGILFFDKNIPKQSISLIEYWKKPYKIGLFG